MEMIADGLLIAGALAAAFYGRHVELENLVSFDMGGTTAKACIIDQGRPTRTTGFEVARVHRFKKGSGLPIKISVIDMIRSGRVAAALPTLMRWA